MRLLIVDDGGYIVQYLKHLIDWHKFGIDDVETTTNSIYAKQRLDEERFDILITDIRMPEVSGIDLLQHVKDNGLDTQVVFLSGYSDFEYTQKAIRLGAVDYLLKPVDKEDMERTMGTVLEKLEGRPLNNSIDWGNMDALGYLLSILCVNSHHLSKDDYRAYHEALGEEPFCFFEVPQATEKDEMILLDLGGRLGRFIWKAGSKAVGLVPAFCIRELEDKISAIRLSETFAFGQAHSARHYFYRFFVQEQVGIDDFELLSSGESFQGMEPGEWECVRKLMTKKFSQLSIRRHKAVFVLEATHFLYLTINKLQSADVKDWIFNQLQDPDAAMKSIVQTIDSLERNNRVSNDAIIQTVQQYIADHISDGLSLEDLGKLVHLHPVYLSKLYKQETGENLSNYIAVKRLEKASQLLKDTDLHVLDISLMVGYKKPQYFIKLFKDEYGITPSQYRRKQIGF